MPDTDRWVAVGAVVKPHGVRGELHIKLFNAGSDVLTQVAHARLERQGAAPVDIAIRRARPAAEGTVLLTLEGVGDRSAAEALRGCLVNVPRSALPPPEPGEFYICDVLGARAVLLDGTEVGRVVDFRSFPTTDVLVVEHEGRRFDVPLVDDFVESVDVVEGRIVVRTLDGLEST